jgi:hypothetical protein
MRGIEKRRFFLLLLATLMVLILPAIVGKGLLSTFLFIFSLSFLFIQSMVVATTKRTKTKGLIYVATIVLIILFILEPFEVDMKFLDLIRLILFATFFGFIVFYLIKFMRKSPKVNTSVIVTAINIYFLMGIISASLAFLFYKILPGAYNIPDYITKPNMVTFNYYSFITMSTVGYGDITPRLPQTQTLAYLVAITGQLYVAIIVAFLVGKLLISADKD